MKKFISLLVLLHCVLTCFGLNVLVPKGEGFKKTTFPKMYMSANNIAKHFGYAPVCFYTYYNRSFNFLFKAFSEDIICITAPDDVVDLTSEEVIELLDSFNYSECFNIYTRFSTLKHRPNYKYLTKKFFINALGLDPQNYIKQNTIVDEKNGFIYRFKNGILSDWESIDGYNVWAAEFREQDPELFNQVYKFAKEVSGNNSQNCVRIVNLLFDGYANIDFTMCSELDSGFYIGDSSVLNYAIYSVIQRHRRIKLDDFLFITFNEAEEIIKARQYRYKGYNFFFNDLGYCTKVYQF